MISIRKLLGLNAKLKHVALELLCSILGRKYISTSQEEEIILCFAEVISSSSCSAWSKTIYRGLTVVYNSFDLDSATGITAHTSLKLHRILSTKLLHVFCMHKNEESLNNGKCRKTHNDIYSLKV